MGLADASQIYPKDTIICTPDDTDSDLFMVASGKLLVCTIQDNIVTPLVYLKPGFYFGELSFFDKKSRSSYVIAVEESNLVHIPSSLLKQQLPYWLSSCALDMVRKVRLMDNAVKSSNSKRRRVKAIQPLPAETQLYYKKIIEQFEKVRNL